MRCIRDGSELSLTRTGIRRDFVFIDDVVAASLRAAFAPAAVGEILNIATGRQFANEDLVSTAERVCDTTVRIAATPYPDRSVDTGYWVADVRKTRRLLGWSARTDLEEGLRETYRWSIAGHAGRRTAAMSGAVS
jgi:nucleoside-diphosphate-sugar epimerase